MGISYNINDDEVIALFKNGKSIMDIAKRLNTTYETVKYRLIRNGLLVYDNGKFIPAKASNLSVMDLAERIELLAKSLKKEENPDPILKQIMKLGLVIDDYVPAGLEVYRKAREIKNGNGSYKELMDAVKRLYSEEENVEDEDYSKMGD